MRRPASDRNSSPHRVIGIDPGSIRLGVAVVERSGSSLRRVHSEVVRCGNGPLPGRLAIIYDAIRRVCADFTPTDAAIEGVFHQKSAQSALVLGHARGVAMLALGHAALPVHEYAPALIKKAVTGRGRADKAQVAAMVELMTGKVDAATADETDAIAVAICHLHASPYSARTFR